MLQGDTKIVSRLAGRLFWYTTATFHIDLSLISILSFLIETGVYILQRGTNNSMPGKKAFNLDTNGPFLRHLLNILLFNIEIFMK